MCRAAAVAPLCCTATQSSTLRSGRMKLCQRVQSAEPATPAPLSAHACIVPHSQHPLPRSLLLTPKLAGRLTLSDTTRGTFWAGQAGHWKKACS